MGRRMRRLALAGLWLWLGTGGTALAKTCQECFEEMANAVRQGQPPAAAAAVCFNAPGGKKPKGEAARAAAAARGPGLEAMATAPTQMASDYERLARLGILNLIQATLHLGAPGTYPVRQLRAPDETRPDERVQLYRSRFLALMAGQDVPLQFLSMQEAASWRAEMLVTKLEEAVRRKEREKILAEPGWRPVGVQLLVQTIAQVVQTKELQPVTDFVHRFYHEAQSIVSLTNQIDEYKWKIAVILAENMTMGTGTASATRQAPTPSAPAPASQPASATARFLQMFHFGGAADFLGSDGEGKLLVSLSVPDEVILDEGTLRHFDAMCRDSDTRLKTRELKQRLMIILQQLRAKQLELIEVYVRYYEHYPVAMILTKLLKNLAICDNTAYVESYSIMREIVDLSLTRHPYVRAMIESGYDQGDRFYHPYLCVKLQMPVPPAQMDDSIIASQILHPRILRRLYEESMRYGAAATLRVLDPGAAERITAEVEVVARQIFTGVTGRAVTVVGAAVRASTPEPLYENLIGPALTPILSRVRTATEGPAAPATPATTPGAAPATTTPGATPPATTPAPQAPRQPLAVPIPELLARIQDYLKPDSQGIDWASFPVPTAATAPSGQGTAEAPAPAAGAQPPAGDYAQAYAWVNRVFGILNRRAADIMEMDRRREQALYEQRYQNKPLPDGLPTQDDVTRARHNLSQAVIDVIHAMEAGIQANLAAKNVAATADDIEALALDTVLFYLKKHTSLARFINNTAMASTTGTRAGVGNDPTLRELWIRLFVRVANAHFRVNNGLDPAAQLPARLGPEPRTMASRMWSIAGYCLGTLAVGAVTSVMFVRGCLPPSVPAVPPPTSPPAVSAPANPGTTSGTERPAPGRTTPPRGGESDPDGDR